MPASAFDSHLTGQLLSDPETAALFQDSAVIKAMLDVEGALALAEADNDLVPQASADRIADICSSLTIDPQSLAEGTARDGVSVPALVAKLRDAVGSGDAPYVHWGATSQDILDTGLILRLRSALAFQETALLALADTLAGLSGEHRATPMAARTRMQQATPTSFGLKAAVWLSALVRHLERLPAIRKNLLVLSFAGASGNLAALGAPALAVEKNLAARLDLLTSPAPWHSVRDGLLDYAGWLTLITGTLGKIGLDLSLLAQSEVGEVRLAGGGSSTMPNKVNPVGAEVLAALARMNAGQLGTLHQAALHEHERSGTGWTLEWLALPQMVMATSGALKHANQLFDSLVVDEARMRANIEASGGLLLAEAASFALSSHMPRPEAQALVKKACVTAAQTGRHLFDVLAEETDAAVAWQELRNPALHLGSGGQMIDRVLESYQAVKPSS